MLWNNRLSATHFSPNVLKASEKEKKELPRIEDIHKPNIICNAYIYTDLHENIFLTGFAANTHFSNSGGGVDYQCMPLHPDYNSFSNSGYWSILSGVEY